MRSLYLTSNCESFTETYENKKLTLSWKTNFDFSKIAFIGLAKLQLVGVISENYLLLPIYCNVIERTTCNPLREIHRLVIDPYVDVINETASGERS